MQSLKASGAILTLTSEFLLSVIAIATHKIRSPTVTNWGDWGYFSRCDPGMVVKGMMLKVEGKLNNGDDTSLNAIRFLCMQIAGVVDEENASFFPYYIWSKEQDWGHWGPTFKCKKNSYAVGFQLRSEPKQGKGDDTAANNLRLFCSSGEMIEGDGLDWGDWTDRQNCGIGYAICGLQTQVQNFQGRLDDTGLNNLKAECCKVQDEIEFLVNGNAKLVVSSYLQKIAVILFAAIRFI